MTRETFETVSPINGEIIVSRHYSSETEMQCAVNSATESQQRWYKRSLAERAAICRQALDYFEQNKTEIALEITQQMGRPIKYSAGEIAGLQERGHYMIDIAEESLSDIQLPDKPGYKRFIRRSPLGTVLILAPWNYPYLTAINTIIPALMAGNPVILKHSAQTPLCAERFVEAFKAAGLPESVFQCLHLRHDQVDRLIKNPKISYVAFTGSVSAGHAIEQSAAGRFIGVGLELGGKDPAYVREDADLHFAIENLVDGAFFNSGQSCCGVERIYVARAVYQQFVEGFVALTKQYCLGSPLDQATTLGPVVSEKAAAFITQQVADAVAAGATACIDPAHFQSNGENLLTNYMAPQVLINVNHTMSVMLEETFGPVVGIMPVESDEEAIQLMNDSPFGLTASIWSQNADLAEAIGNRIETGTVFMNRCDYLDPALVWTGVKNTGRGASLSQLGYQSLTQPKSFHLRIDI